MQGRLRGVLMVLVIAALAGLVPVERAQAAGEPEISVGDATVVEGDDTTRLLHVPLTLSAPATATFSVHYTTVDGSATGGSDFTAKSGTIKFTAAKATGKTPTSKFLTITIRSDTVNEGTETFQLVLSDIGAAAVPGRTTGTATILDEDATTAPTANLGDVSVAEGDAEGTRKVQLEVTLSAAMPAEVSLYYTVTALTATSQIDSKPKAAAYLRFKPGKTKATVPIFVIPDVTAEIDEQIVVAVASASGIALGRGTGHVTILDDDGATTGTPPSVVDAGQCGTWALEQAGSVAELQNDEGNIDSALSTPGVRGLSIRVPWNAIETKWDLLNAAHQIALDHGKPLSVRFMAGRYTPASVFTGGSPYYTLSDGAKVPLPFNANGTPNTVFENAYGSLVQRLGDWARTHNVKLLHMPWYGQDYSELNHGPSVRSANGYSQTNFVTAHKRLIDLALNRSGTGVSVEFPMSGHGPLIDVSQLLADYIVGQAGSWSGRITMQSNGWGPVLQGVGNWGATGPSVENSMDAIWTRRVRRGEQAIQPDNYDWTTLFREAQANGSDYVEVYTPSFSMSARPLLISAIAAFDPPCH